VTDTRWTSINTAWRHLPDDMETFPGHYDSILGVTCLPLV